MIRIFLGSILLLLVILSGCAKKPNLYSSDEVMQEFEPNYFDFKYLSSKGRIVIEEANGKTTRGTINFRAKNDSIIWFSITPGLGLEAFRGAVTKDKVRIKDRLNGQDINMSFSEIEDRYKLKLSLELLQNLVYADIPYEFDYRDRLIRIGQYFELTQVREEVRYHSRVGTKHGKVEELSSTSMSGMGSLMANYPTFEDIGNQPYPNKMLLKISYNSPEGGQQIAIVNLEMSKIEIQESSISFPFQF
jgi:hypothetical protein